MQSGVVVVAVLPHAEAGPSPVHVSDGGGGSGAAAPLGHLGCYDDDDGEPSAGAGRKGKGSSISVGFEGPEKVVEIDFSPSKGPALGARLLTRAQWDAILQDAGMSILLSRSNAHFDSYVLSESSLFVYPHNIVLKTCGQSTPFLCLPKLVEFTKNLGCEVEWLAYTRKNFTFPSAQLFPHTAPNVEYEYLQQFFSGDTFVLGPISGDHWFVYISDRFDRPAVESNDRMLDMMMFDVDQSVASMFYSAACACGSSFSPGDAASGTPRPPALPAATGSAPSGDVDGTSDILVRSGISAIFPDADIHGWQFEPCGYSCNGMMDNSYFTIHVTPEAESSYVSFGTNVKRTEYGSVVDKVLRIFKPQRFTMTMFADEQGVKEIEDHPFHSCFLPHGEAGPVYALTARSQSEYNEYRSFLANYKRQASPSGGLETTPLKSMSWT